MFVAVGNTIAVSPDGLVFTEKTNPGAFALFDVVKGNGRWVAVGENNGSGGVYVLTSDDDGDTWQIQTNSLNIELYGLTFGNDLFVAVGKNGSNPCVATSEDGEAWTLQSVPALTGLDPVSLRGIDFGDNLFVAVGDWDDPDAYVITSADGETWVRRSNSRVNPLFGVVYSSTLGWVAGGPYDSNVIKSSNGTSWSDAGTPGNFLKNSIAFGANIFLAVGPGSNEISKSEDGDTWTDFVSIGSSLLLQSIAFGSDVFVAAGLADNFPSSNTDCIVVSDDAGATWSNVSLGVEDAYFNSVAFSGASLPSPPVISHAGFVLATPTSAVISFETDVPITAYIEYGLTTLYGQQTTITEEMLLEHGITLLGLLPGKTYHYRIHVFDEFSQETVSEDFTFTTPCQEAGVRLRWSSDGGHTWSNYHTKYRGNPGEYGKRVVWRRLGQGRDRVFEISGSDPVKTIIIGASLEATPGVH